MDSKNEHAYREVFTTLQQSLPADHRHGLEHFFMDFELLSSTAIKAVFPETIQGQRRLQEAGHSVAYMNQENSELREQFHALISLSHVPPDDVLSAYDLISDNCLDELDVVINHLDEYYVRSRRRGRGRRQPIQAISRQNVYARVMDGLPCTNNKCEAWIS